MDCRSHQDPASSFCVVPNPDCQIWFRVALQSVSSSILGTFLQRWPFVFTQGHLHMPPTTSSASSLRWAFGALPKPSAKAEATSLSLTVHSELLAKIRPPQNIFKSPIGFNLDHQKMSENETGPVSKEKRVSHDNMFKSDGESGGQISPWQMFYVADFSSSVCWLRLLLVDELLAKRWKKKAKYTNFQTAVKSNAMPRDWKQLSAWSWWALSKACRAKFLRNRQKGPMFSRFTKLCNITHRANSKFLKTEDSEDSSENWIGRTNSAKSRTRSQGRLQSQNFHTPWFPIFHGSAVCWIDLHLFCICS